MKKNLLFYLMALVFCWNTAEAQVYSGYLQEGFEGATFPPTDWQTANPLGTAQWTRSTGEHHSGAASAYMIYQLAGGEDWLITPKFEVVATDKVTFWMLLDFQGYAPDELSVRVSTTTAAPASFTTAILTLAEGTNYPANATTWYPYEVSLAAYAGQQIYIAFKHSDTNGDGLYLDDIAIGTQPANDVTVQSFDGPAIIGATGTTPMVTVKNNGSAVQTFDVTATGAGGYSSTMTVTGLAANTTQQVTFANWLPPAAGVHTLTVTATLAGDVNLTNNTLTKDYTLYTSFPNNGWVAKAALPAGRFGLAVAAKANATNDAASLFAIAGSDSVANTPLNQMFAEPAGTWATMAPMPAARSQVSAMVVGDKIYVPGGYSGSFTPSNVLYIYDIPTNTWSTGATLPTAVGDYAIAKYNDTHIYVVGGYNGTADVNLVQVYDIAANTWAQATPKTGTASAGLRGGIANGKIVTAGGYSQVVGAPINEPQIGQINASNPLDITWTALPAMPFGAAGRLGGGAMGERVYFTGGDPLGDGATALAATYAYNVTTSAWEVGPAKTTGVSNICNFAPVQVGGHNYMIAVGGYTGSAFSTANEWLDLGEVQLGTNEVSQKAFVSIYPNPSSSQVSVTLTDFSGYSNVKLAVYDMNGRKIADQLLTAETTTVDVTSYASGVYVFHITSDKGMVTKQVVKQ